MLVLSRRLHEKIVLPGLGITLQVVSIKGKVVRLGIEAPPDVKVFREEIANHLPEPAQRPRRAEPCRA
jgi:two-component system, OmpR family, response regulator